MLEIQRFFYIFIETIIIIIIVNNNEYSYNMFVEFDKLLHVVW